MVAWLPVYEAMTACVCRWGCHQCEPENFEDPSEDADQTLVAINRAAPFVDAGWSPAPGAQVAPSAVLKNRYFVMSTNHFIGIRLAEQQARDWVAKALEIGRDRYRRGYHANPFGDPVVRPC
ncbi:hypothetical protein [Sphingomonas sp. Leaf10]|uniref:hypothetical protein n=1 Tax=Sphingomonas sp. Leaf10 TaxID=1735676 RepID=UPI00138F07F0|nr:hypothetical protein [Sphingomonas sp. Leaf10]